MKISPLIILLLNAFWVSANNPLKPLIKRDTISYFHCYEIDTATRSSFAPYTFFKINNNYYEGIAFPFRNDDCLENYTGIPDSSKVDYKQTLDSLGEWSVYEKIDSTESYYYFKPEHIPEFISCLDNGKRRNGHIYQFSEVRFIAAYYLIRCKKPRNCSGPDTICDRLVDIFRTPVFTKIEQILD